MPGRPSGRGPCPPRSALSGEVSHTQSKTYDPKVEFEALTGWFEVSTLR